MAAVSHGARARVHHVRMGGCDAMRACVCILLPECPISLACIFADAYALQMSVSELHTTKQATCHKEIHVAHVSFNITTRYLLACLACMQPNAQKRKHITRSG